LRRKIPAKQKTSSITGSWEIHFSNRTVSVHVVCTSEKLEKRWKPLHAFESDESVTISEICSS
jgi:hypothetical protein